MEAKYCQQTKTWLVMRYNQLYMNIHGVGGHVACARVNVASTRCRPMPLSRVHATDGTISEKYREDRKKDEMCHQGGNDQFVR